MCFLKTDGGGCCVVIAGRSRSGLAGGVSGDDGGVCVCAAVVSDSSVLL